MQVNIRKLISYSIMLVLGLSLTLYGVIDLTISRYAPDPMSDEEIIERAVDLGMVNIKDKWIEEINSEKASD